MTLIEVIGNQHLRILTLEETLGQREAEISKLQEKVVQLTPKPTVEAVDIVLGEAAA